MDAEERAPFRGLAIVVPAIRLPQDYARLEHFAHLADQGAAGFLVFGGDDELLPPFLERLRAAAGRPLLIMSDVEQGVGQQVQGCMHLPPLMAVGASESEERAYEHGRSTALEARRVGINVLLAPVVDVLSQPNNPIIGPRSFGSHPDLVARLSRAWIEGAQDQGVLACAKHFPGHGDTVRDSHDLLPRVSGSKEALALRELVPFQAAIEAGVAAVMTAHVAYPGIDPSPDLPATLSRPILRDLLRDEMGFGGLVITDALVMGGFTGGPADEPFDEPSAAVRAVEAGCDLLLYPADPVGVARALEEAHAEGRIDLLDVQGRLLLTTADLPDGSAARLPSEADHDYVGYSLARDSVTCLSNDESVLPLDVGGKQVMVLVVDDDDASGDELMAPFEERRTEFGGGLARRTTWKGRGHLEEDAILGLAEDADIVLMPIFCRIRASKGRAGLKPELARLVLDVLDVAPVKTVCVLCCGPAALASLEARPATVVAVWGEAPVSIRAGLDALLGGSPLRGVDPSPPESL